MANDDIRPQAVPVQVSADVVDCPGAFQWRWWFAVDAVAGVAQPGPIGGRGTADGRELMPRLKPGRCEFTELAREVLMHQQQLHGSWHQR